MLDERKSVEFSGPALIRRSTQGCAVICSGLFNMFVLGQEKDE